MTRSAPSANPAGRQYRQRRLARDVRNQFVERTLAAHVAAGFDALRDDDVRAGVFYGPCFGKRAYLASNDDPSVAQSSDQCERDVPEQAYRRYIEFDARRNLRFEQLAMALSDQMLAAPLTVVGLGHEQSVPIF